MRLSAFEMLSTLASLQEVIHKSNSNTIPGFLLDLCEHIEVNLLQLPTTYHYRKQGMSLDTLVHQVLVASLWCLYQWVSHAPWVMRDKELAKVVMSCLVTGLQKKNKNVQTTCLVVLRYLLYDSGLHTSFPPECLIPTRVAEVIPAKQPAVIGTMGPHPSLYTAPTDTSILAYLKDQKKIDADCTQLNSLHHFLLNKRCIISIIQTK